MLRSLLFVPGQRARFYEKLRQLRPDAVILDLEDAVPPGEKAAAREMVAQQLGGPHLEGLTVFARVNSVDSPYFREDIRAIVAPGLHGIFLPKTDTAEQLHEANMLIAQVEIRREMMLGTVRLVPVIETVLGALHAQELAIASPRVEALAFGSEDFSLDLGVERSPEGVETRLPRAQLALVAHGARIGAIDTPWTAIDDQEGLIRETVEARQLGFTGKQAIHPSQIAPIHAVFTPSDEEVAWARRVVEAYEEAIASGTGAINLDGRLIDVPMVARARRVLARAGA